jgi:methylthioribose-1-phosphate isomerase
MAPEGVRVWNPAFDITPAGLIDAIVTEVGVIERDTATGAFDMKSPFK